MDNFFEILIYILILISFISSFFRKKDKEKKAEQQRNADNQPGRHPVQEKTVVPEETKPAESFDIVKEMEKFFQVGQPQEKPKPKALTTNIEDKIKEEIRQRRDFKEVPEDSFHKRTVSEHTFVDPWDKKRKEIERFKKSVDKRTEKKAEKFQEYLEIRTTAATDIIQTIRQRLSDPSSLKEYVIISEIIGKPKALK